MLLIPKSPKFQHPLQIKLANNLMSGEHGVHVGLEAQFGVHTLLVELDFDEAVGVGADDEVYFGPVDHYYFLDKVNNIR